MAKEGIARDGNIDTLNSFTRNSVNPILKRQGKLLILNVQSLDRYSTTLVLERLKIGIKDMGDIMENKDFINRAPVLLPDLAKHTEITVKNTLCR